MAPEKGNDCGHPFWAPRAVGAKSRIEERSSIEKRHGISERSPLLTAAVPPTRAFSLLLDPGEKPSSRLPGWRPARGVVVDATEAPEGVLLLAARAVEKLASRGDQARALSLRPCGTTTGELSACRPGPDVGPSAGSAIC